MRRLITIPAVLFMTALLTLTAVIWIPVAAVLSLIKPIRGLLRFLLFITLYAWCETCGIVASVALWLRYGCPRPPEEPESATAIASSQQRWQSFLQANFRLQCWWGTSLKQGTERIFGLTFEFDNPEALLGTPPIWLLRHASMGDTVVPVAFYCTPMNVSLRYVLKKELLYDPCLDIVGNRLPNYFVDRSSDTPAQEIAKIAELVKDLGPNEGALIYPEGTRFTPTKRANILRQLQERADHNQEPSEIVRRAENWPNLLPPRIGGPIALIQNNPGRDLLFCAHVGFEGSSRFQSLINGSWVNSRVRVRYWRVPFADIPTDDNGARQFVFDQWDRMAREVADLSSN